MKNIEFSHVTGQSFDTISPSARALLLLKGHTDIPFVREAAALISKPEAYEPDFSKRDFHFWGRVLHFEMRYKSLNELMTGLDITNFLELSSGFSFRGLNAALHNAIYYIDTDLEELIATKKELISQLRADLPALKGTLDVRPLNALNEQQFNETAKTLPAGELIIVNEGLLMYLDMEEKKRLCSTIRNVLKERGGYWVTADAYVKTDDTMKRFETNDKLQRFFEEHKIEENKFDDFEAAEAFFKEQGFVIDKEASQDYASMSSFKYFMESLGKEHMEMMGKGRKMQASWRLKLA